MELNKHIPEFGDLKHYKDDIYYNVDKFGDKRYWKDEKLHREDGPAIETKSGDRFWLKEGKLHRLDGPAVEHAGGDKIWYKKGKKYTEEEFKEKVKMIEFQKDPKWKFALGFGELKNYKDEVYYNVDKDGDKRYWKDGKFHREDGPAIEWGNGSREWYKEGRLHREDGPAIKYANGSKFWYKEGKFHREDGPAVEHTSMYKAWYKEGKRHRDDGPAYEGKNGYKEWWIEGEKYTEEEYKEEIKIIEFEKDPKWKYALRFGDLKHYKDEVYYNVDKDGDKRYWKYGKLHREDGPAVEYANGDKKWWIEGIVYTEEEFLYKIKIMEFNKDPKWKEALKLGELKHCKDEIYYNVSWLGSKRYWKYGKLHREDGPAVELYNGNKAWYKEGKPHREDGPAYEAKDGDKWWYKEGKRHREDGPAIEYSDGYKEWYIEGIFHTEEEFNRKINNKSSFNDLMFTLPIIFTTKIFSKKNTLKHEKQIILKVKEKKC